MMLQYAIILKCLYLNLVSCFVSSIYDLCMCFFLYMEKLPIDEVLQWLEEKNLTVLVARFKGMKQIHCFIKSFLITTMHINKFYTK